MYDDFRVYHAFLTSLIVFIFYIMNPQGEYEKEHIHYSSTIFLSHHYNIHIVHTREAQKIWTFFGKFGLSRIRSGTP